MLVGSQPAAAACSATISWSANRCPRSTVAGRRSVVRTQRVPAAARLSVTRPPPPTWYPRSTPDVGRSALLGRGEFSPHDVLLLSLGLPGLGQSGCEFLELLVVLVADLEARGHEGVLGC